MKIHINLKNLILHVLQYEKHSTYDIILLNNICFLWVSLCHMLQCEKKLIEIKQFMQILPFKIFLWDNHVDKIIPIKLSIKWIN